MRKLSLLSLAFPVLLGCSSTTSFVDSDTTLGRIVVYRNGVAYYERTAEVDGDTLELKVPADKVDDFLKSLTVIDAETQKPAPIAYPTRPNTVSSDGTVTMNVKLTGNTKPKKLRLTYVTESPSWKPSYRVVIGEGGKVTLMGWAIVDNTSGEDWKSVKLGVGSSSALSFRYDLSSIRTVARETLSPEDLFAQAPPTGGAVLQNAPPGTAVITMFDDNLLNEASKHRVTVSGAGVTADKKADKLAGKSHRSKLEPPKEESGLAFGGRNSDGETENQMPASPMGGLDRFGQLAQQINQQGKKVTIEGWASKSDKDRSGAALYRANQLRDRLIQNGVSPDQVVAVANLELQAEAGGARVLEEKKPAAQPKEPEAGEMLEPIGASHFESKVPMTVPAGTSAMVSILDSSTKGEVVYLYDPESSRGNKTFAFKSVRLENPTGSTLETGPVTVYGEGRFIGEGFTDPIPGKSMSFVPFALDRQIVVEQKEEETDGIARILTAQRGVFSTEMRHTKKQKIVISNRLGEEATVYLRHTVQKGYKLSNAPKDSERLGEAHLFRVKVPAKGKIEVAIEEETPVLKTVDLRSAAGIDLIRAFVSSAALEGDIKKRVEAIISMQKDLGTLEERIETARQQQEEYRSRMNELHAQIVTLKAVRTAGPLMRSLEKKLEEVSEKMSKATVDLVGLEEQRMISRIKLQDGIAELSFEGKEGAAKLANQ
jgi:hypothetical protein